MKQMTKIHQQQDEAIVKQILVLMSHEGYFDSREWYIEEYPPKINDDIISFTIRLVRKEK